jgi:hypothetical protein
LVLYSFDFTDGATSLKLLSTIDVSAFPSLNFKSISLNRVAEGNDNLQNDANYANIVGTLVIIDTATSQTIVRKIL